MKNNRFISILLCILIILSGANLLVGVNNTIRIRQLENSPPVVIENFEAEHLTTEKQTMTFRNDSDENISDASAQKQVSSEENFTASEKTNTTEATKNNSVCYVTASGTKYHKDGCSYLKKSKTQMTVSEANAYGYSPCSRCY